MTNNSQTIYLEEPTTVGNDDETTIVFTQNMNRIMMEPGPAIQQTHEEDNNESMVDIIKTMNNLPDHHEVWEYLDPTRAYYKTGQKITLTTIKLDPSLTDMITS
jgi:hypothetical protein